MSTIVKDFDTCVLSTSGYTIDDAAANIGSPVNGHTDKDIVILQVGTNDLQNCNQFQLADKYSVLINNTKQTAPDSQIVVTAIPNRITAKSNEVNKKLTFLIKPFVSCVIRTANVYLQPAVLNLLPNFIAEMVIISTQLVLPIFP